MSTETRLYLVRHAWAGSSDDPKWPDDRLRPLTPEGRKRFKSLAKRLVKRGLKVQRIATSPLVRCRQTAELLADAIGDVVIEDHEGLAPGAQLEDLLAWSRRLQESDIAWVAHAPDVSHLAARLLGGEPVLRFPKGAVAAFAFNGPLSAGSAELLWLANAELLGV